MEALLLIENQKNVTAFLWFIFTHEISLEVMHRDRRNVLIAQTMIIFLRVMGQLWLKERSECASFFSPSSLYATAMLT